MPHNKLRQWLEQTKTTQLRLAELTGISQTQITKYVNGLVMPGIHNARLIRTATGGAVSVESWDDKPDTAQSLPQAVQPASSRKPKSRVA